MMCFVNEVGKIMKRWLILLVVFVSQISMANELKNYKFEFSINNMHCSFRINGVPIYTTFGSYRNPIGVTSGYTAGHALDDGRNEIEIEAYNITDVFNLGDQANGHCQVIINEISKDGITAIASLRVVYNDENKLSIDYPTNLGQSNILEIAEIESIPNRMVGKFDTPRLKAKRGFAIQHPANLSWRKSTPFKDTPENKQKVWEKYNELRNALKKSDVASFTKMMQPGWGDVAAFEGRTADNYVKMMENSLLLDFLDLKPQYWVDTKIEDYDLRLYAGGRLFQLVAKNSENGSPIEIQTNQVTTLNPMLMYLDGEIQIAW